MVKRTAIRKALKASSRVRASTHDASNSAAHDNPPKKISRRVRAEMREPSRRAVYEDFARRLTGKMLDRGLSQSKLARQCQMAVPRPDPGEQPLRFTRDLISNYVRGETMPQRERLAVLAKVLHCEISDLLPSGAYSPLKGNNSGFTLRDAGDGHVYLQINHTIDMNVAARIVGLLRKEERSTK